MATTTTTITGNVTATGNLTGTFLYGDGSNINLPGANGHVAIYDVVSSNLSSEAALATTRGGTGADTSAATGFAYVTGGTWSFSNTPAVTISPHAKSATLYNYVQTLNDTATTIATFDVAPMGADTKTATSVSFEITSGRIGDGGADINTETWFAEYDITYNSTGTTAVITKVKETKSGSIPAYAVTVTNVTSAISVEVTGAAATTVNWSSALRYLLISFTD